MRVLKLLQHLQLIVDHALVAANILLENDLDRNLGTILGLSLTDDTVCTRTERTSELVQGPERRKYVLARGVQGRVRESYFFS